MMSRRDQNRKRRPGQPIMVLAALILGWGGMRAAVWESPFSVSISPLFAAAGPLGRTALTPVEPAVDRAAQTYLRQPSHQVPDGDFAAAPMIAAAQPVAVDWTAPQSPRSLDQQPQVLASYQLLWLAAMAQVPVPGDVAAMINASPVMANARMEPGLKGADMPAVNRLSLDGWLFLRPGSSGTSALGSRPATYGASQAGAVLRYHLEPNDRRQPAAYLRATQALAAGREGEVAAGLSARLLAGVPVAVHAELRATRRSGETELRPAAFAVSQLAPAELPLGLRAEAYVAAGYVGGDFAGAFADGQARIDREVTRFDLGSLRAGAGAWGGAQKGASRVDIGPTASATINLGDMPARLSMDYRVRIAGDAQPESGAALTLSTGF